MSDRTRIIAIDGANLASGTDARQTVPIAERGKQFELRRIVGANTVATKLQLYRPGADEPLFSAPISSPSQILISPGLRYDGSHALTADFLSVAKATVACGGFPIYNAMLGLQGVIQDNYPETFAEAGAVPFKFTFALNVDWYRYLDLVSGTPNAPHLFGVRMNYGHFALTEVQVSKAGVALATEDFYIRLYDENYSALSNRPVPMSWYNAIGPLSSALWPPVWYSRSREISFEIESRICNLDLAMPKAYQITFSGLLWR